MSKLKTTPWILWIAVLFLPSPAWAQAGASVSTEEARRLTERGRTMFEQVVKDREEAFRIVAEIQTAEGEEKRILRRRLAELQVSLLDDLGDIVENVRRQEDRGIDAGALRAQLEPMMIEIAGRGPEVAAEQLDRLRAMRDRLESDPPDDPEAFERQFNRESDWLDTIHRACLEHYERMVTLGLDGSALRAFLEQSLVRGADSLAGRLELATERVAATRSRLTETPTDATLQARLRVAELRTEGTARSLSENVAMMKRLGLETTRYQQVLIQATGDITTDVLDTKVALGLLQSWIEDGRDWLVANGPNLVFRALVLVLLLAAFWIAARFVRRIVRRSVRSSRLNFSKLLQDMIVGFAGKAVFLLGILLALSQVGVSLGPLLAGLGIVGFIVGFALQDVLGNFAAGVMILIYRPFDVGDMVDAATVFGKVHRMNLVSTTLLTIDHQTLIVPNSKIWGDVIKNVTSQDVRRVDMTFGVSYADDIPKTEAILKQIVEAHPMVLDDPEPMIRLSNLGDSSVDFIVRPWVKTDDYWDVLWDVTREVKMRFDAEGISIPFPQRDVHLFTETPTAPA